MLSQIFDFFSMVETFFWGYIGFMLIVLLGFCLTFQTRFFQLRAMPHLVSTFGNEIHTATEARGLHPIRAFFASVGGIGVGNVVAIVMAVQLGGPGALFWAWVASFFGSLIKYSEVYLGLKHRVKNDQHGYDGGPMYFLQKAFAGRFVAVVVSLLLCLYGAEIYLFNVVVDTLSDSWGLSRLPLVAALLGLIFYAVIGGVPRVVKLCSAVMPPFIIIYIAMCFWVIGYHIAELPAIFLTVFKSAFSGHAAVGGFAGSSIMLAIQHGMAGTCYSADLGVGNDSIIQSEVRTVQPERQARMAFFGVCLDSFICTLSILVALVSGFWQAPAGSGTPVVQLALAEHFPSMHLIMPGFIFILGYTTLITYLIVGMKCARFVFPKKGASIYLVYALCAFTFFSFFDQTVPLLVMRLSGVLLLILNLAGIYRLRHDVVFSLQPAPQPAAVLAAD